MKQTVKSRALSLLLSAALLLSAMPGNVFSTFAAESDTSDADYSANVGKNATLNRAESITVVEVMDAEPDAGWDPLLFDIAEFPTDLVFEITAYKVVSETFDITDETTGEVTGQNTIQSLWYQVSTASGTAPVDFADGYWILQNYLGTAAYEDDALIISENDDEPETAAIVDKNRNAITELTLPQYGKIDISAKTSLQTPAEYLWQVLVPGTDTWVDIYGENTAELPVTYALLKNVLTKDGTARIRCAAGDGETFAYSDAVTVTVAYDAKYLETPISVQPAAVSGETMQTFSLLQSRSLNAAAPAAEYETRTITIHYVDEDGDMVFEDYVESWPVGSTVTHSVTLPVKVGYEATYDGNSITELSLASIGTLEDDVEFTVVYTPADVEYTVHYLFQNITDDGYLPNEDLHATETRTGKTGELTQFTPPEITGFTCLYYDQVEIAADGSTEIEIYYDREYYLISFELGDSGYGTDPIYARYGATVVATVPTRSGWTFNGWDPTIAITNGAYQLTVTQNATYTALWTRGDTTFTVVYWKENANPNQDADGNVVVDSSGHPVYGYSYWTHESDIAATTGDVIDGADYQTRINDLVDDEAYFTFNPGKTDSGIVVEGDGTTVVNVYYTRNTYTIYFYAEGACGITAHTHSDECYQYICDKSEHTHTDDCLSCTQPEHTHDGVCCTLTEHTHDASCCNLIEHSHDASCCDIPEHTHSAANGCTLNCQHQHTFACYGSSGRTNVNNNLRQAINQIDGAPVSGYVYSVSYDTNRNGTVTNYYLYYNGIWYSASADMIEGDQIGEDGTYETGGRDSTEYTAKQYKAAIDCVHTEHDSSCYECDQTAHTHGTGCNTNACEVGYEHTHGTNCNADICEVGYEHTCDIGDCECTKTAHTHSAGCYGESCTADGVAHTHTDACKRLACDLVEHAHSSSCPSVSVNKGNGNGNGNEDNSSSRTYHVVYTITAKYEENIADVWPTSGHECLASTTDFYGWNFTNPISGTTLVTKRPTMTTDLCDTDDNEINLYANWSSDLSKYQVNYWFESLDQSDTTTSSTRVSYYNEDTRETKYYELSTEYTQEAMSGGNWSAKIITGMSNIGENEGNNQVDFYYDRNVHTVTFVNADKNTVKEFSDVMYGFYVKNLTYDNNGTTESVRTLVPSYPAGFEPNAYVFDGWYTTPDCFPGTEVDWDTFTVPNDDTILYAHWVPTTHTVKVWLDETMTTQIGATQTVSHGDPANNPGEFDRGQYANYSHAGWFYLNAHGEEKAFVFNKMPVNRDLDVYAKWSSTTAVQYDVHYVLGIQNDDGTITAQTDTDGNPIYVADSTYGTKLAGHSITFDAKAGAELYPAYQGADGTFYFPHTNSHTILMSVDGSNTFTFYYLEMALPGYTVQYIDEATGDKLIDDKVVSAEDNDKSVVTETFVKITGYMPDAYQKTLILSANEDENVIIFYYTQDTEHAFYRVNHFVEQLDGSYKLYSYFEGPGNIGQPVPEITKANINGYTYQGYIEGEDTSGSITPGDPPERTLTADGYLVNLYYDLNKYPYVIQYLEYGTNKELAAPDKYLDESQWLPYGDTFTGTAKEITGYTLVSESPQTKQINVDDTTNPTENVITFYYTENQAHINYVVVPSDGGQVTTSHETVKVLNDTLTGSTPTAEAGYEFKGWFMDPECTIPVDSAWVNADTKHITPQSNKGDGVPYVTATYYALFEPIGHLKIEKNVVIKEGSVTPPAFTFTVTLPEGAKTSYSVTYNGTNASTTSVAAVDGKLTLTLNHGESVVIHDLPIGSYTVTEQAVLGFGSSFPYADTNGNTSTVAEVTTGETTTVTCTNTYPVYIGHLRVDKDVTKVYGKDQLPDHSFPITITLTPEAAAMLVDRGYSYQVYDANNNAVGSEVTGTITAGTTSVTIDGISLKDGQYVVITGLPVGSYTVTEDLGDLANDYNAPSYTNPTGTITAEHTATASIVNQYKQHLGNLTIRKDVTKEFSGDEWTGDTFTFTVTGSGLIDGNYTVLVGGVEQTVTVSNGELTLSGVSLAFTETGTKDITITDLPIGTYSVTETPNDAYTTTASGHTDMTVTADSTPTAVFTNTLNRLRGDLTISKTVEVLDGSTPPDTTFEFTVTLTGEQLDGTYDVKYSNGTTGTITVASNRFTVRLQKDQTVTIQGLPVCGYKIVENVVEGYRAVWTGNEGSIPAGSEAEASCNNQYPVNNGDLQIDKTVTKQYGKDTWSGGKFTFTVTPATGITLDADSYSYSIGDTSGTVTPVNNTLTVEIPVTALDTITSLVIADLPVGSYTVTETVPEDYTVDANDQTAAVNSTNPVKVSFTNTYRKHLGTLTIEKTVSNWNKVPADDNQSFLFHVTGNGVDMDVVITMADIRAGNGTASVTIHDLPLGSYTVTEDTSWGWRYELTGWDTSDTTLTLDDLNGTATFTNQYKTTNKWLNYFVNLLNQFTATT